MVVCFMRGVPLFVICLTVFFADSGGQQMDVNSIVVGCRVRCRMVVVGYKNAFFVVLSFFEMDLLPTDLLQAIVDGFIDVGDVCVMDIACCNRVLRPEWLILLSKAKLVGTLKEYSLRPCLQWIAARNAMFSPFYLDQSAIARAMKRLSPDTRLYRIVDMVFSNLEPTVKPDRKSLDSFMAMFPQLRSLRINGVDMKTINEQLAALETVPVALTLILLNQNNSMAENNIFIEAIRRLGANLQEFTCNAVNDAVLEVLIDLGCPLRVIDIKIKQFPIFNVFANLCAQNIRTLVKVVCSMEHWQFAAHEYASGILQNILEVISSAGNRIKILEIIVLNCAAAANYVVAHCPNLERAKLICAKSGAPGVGLSLVKLTNGSFVCDVNSPSRQATEFFAEVHFPIRSLSGGGLTTPLRLNVDQLAWLAKTHGRNLESVTLDLTSVCDDIVCQFLSRCPNLKEFRVSKCSFMAETIAILPQLLPKVTKLGLLGCFIENCEEDDILGVLEGFRRNDLSFLELQANDDMTDNVLLKIVDCCPRLQTLELFHGNFYKQTVFNLIFTKKLNASVIRCPDAEWIEERLKMFDFEPIPDIFERLYD